MINNIELEKVAEIKLLGGDNTSQPGYPTLSQSLCSYQLTSRSVFALFCGCILVLVQKQDSLVFPHTWFSHVPVPDVLIVTSFLKEWQLFSPPWVVFFFNPVQSSSKPWVNVFTYLWERYLSFPCAQVCLENHLSQGYEQALFGDESLESLMWVRTVTTVIETVIVPVCESYLCPDTNIEFANPDRWQLIFKKECLLFLERFISCSQR